MTAESRWRPDASRLAMAPCPLCGGTRFAVLATSDRYDMDLQTVGCRGCGLVMTNPQPTASALDDFYTHHYRHYYQKVEKPDLAYLEKTRKPERAANTAAFLKAQGLLPPDGAVLDIGAAEGAILHAARAAEPGTRAVAVEPNPLFGEFARGYAGCALYPDLAALPESERGAFSLIVINHVLEHIAEPVGFLSGLRGWLRPGGVLYIDVPDVERYEGLEALHIAHLYHFCERTLRATLAAAGYEVRLLERHTPLLHPHSLRVVCAPAAQAPLRDPGFGTEGWVQLARIERRAQRFHRRRWSPGRRAAHVLRWLLRPANWRRPA